MTDQRVSADTLGCPLRGIAWSDGRVVDSEVTLEEVSTVAEDDNTLLWLDLTGPSREDMIVLARHLGLSPTLVEDVLSPLERPKVVRHSDHAFFMVYATALTEPDRAAVADGSSRLRTSRVSGLVYARALVTIREDDGFDIEEVVRRWEDNADLLRFGAGALLHGLLDTVVDTQFDTIQRLDDAMEGLETELFEERGVDRDFLRTVYGLRKDLVELRRVVLPMREVVNGVLRHRPEEATDLSRWYDDLYDHVLRAAEWTESLRDMVTTIFETHLSLQDTRLNTVMKKLAGWAAIIAVPTAVTGWFGQNVPYPGFGHQLGVWLTTGTIVALSGALYVSFRRRDWL
jgi:magnesium transporter